MAVGNLGAEELSTSGLPYVVQDVLGTTLGNIVLGCVAIAIFVCILANQTGAMQMMFAMSAITRCRPTRHWPASTRSPGVYNPAPPFHWYLQWGAVLFCGVAFGLGYAYYRFVQRRRIAVLPEHASALHTQRPADKRSPGTATCPPAWQCFGIPNSEL